jgi:hypothetical protein
VGSLESYVVVGEVPEIGTCSRLESYLNGVCCSRVIYLQVTKFVSLSLSLSLLTLSKNKVTVYLHSLLTSTLDVFEYPASCSNSFITCKIPLYTYRKLGWVGLTDGLKKREDSPIDQPQ